MNRTVTALLLLACSSTALAESCLQTDKKGVAGDSRYYDYGRCSRGASGPNTDSLGVIAKQLQGLMGQSDNAAGRGYTDAERAAGRQSLARFKDEQDARRASVKLGATMELIQSGDLVYSRFQYQRADIGEDQRQAIRNELGRAIESGKLLDTYGALPFEDRKSPATWATTDPATRWKTCEVATQVSRALAYGDFIEPQQKNPARALTIARAGYQERCGGTAYWLGRIYEDGDAVVPGVSRSDLREFPKETIIEVFDVAILNGYVPAYERMAELYRLGGPPRYRGKSDWSPSPLEDGMFMSKFQYTECLKADPANLACAQGLRTVYGNTKVSFGYKTYDAALLAYYEDYVRKLEGLLAK